MPLAARAVVGLVARLTWRVVARAIQGVLTRDEWFVALRRRRDGALPSSLAGFQPVLIADGYVVDPILVDGGTRTHLFVEAWDEAAGRGRIALIDPAHEGRVPQHPQIVFETPTHLSYPTVVRWGDDWFLIPENWAGGVVDLYRGDPFPDRWQYVATLLDDVRATRRSTSSVGGWLFLTLTERGSNPWGELSLFWPTTSPVPGIHTRAIRSSPTRAGRDRRGPCSRRPPA